jgi:hypothetical protein
LALRVVPPNQAQLMADAVRGKSLPVALLMSANELYGFRQAANVGLETHSTGLIGQKINPVAFARRSGR